MHIQVKKRILTLLFAVLLLLSVNVTVYANESVDLSKKGTISVSMSYNGAAIAGGTLTLYRIGTVTEDNGNYSFTLTEDFDESGADLNNTEYSESAAALAQYALENGTKSIAEEDIGNDGIAVFSDLETGLYLIIQNKAADGYQSAAPFLVSVPMNENGIYIYTVDASPKVELQTEKQTGSDSNKNNASAGQDGNGSSSGSNGNSSSSVSKDSTLPYTGQLNWPVSVLAVSGLFLFLAGWALRSGKKEISYET